MTMLAIGFLLGCWRLLHAAETACVDIHGPEPSVVEDDGNHHITPAQLSRLQSALGEGDQIVVFQGKTRSGCSSIIESLASMPRGTISKDYPLLEKPWRSTMSKVNMSVDSHLYLIDMPGFRQDNQSRNRMPISNVDDIIEWEKILKAPLYRFYYVVDPSASQISQDLRFLQHAYSSQAASKIRILINKMDLITDAGRRASYISQLRAEFNSTLNVDPDKIILTSAHNATGLTGLVDDLCDYRQNDTINLEEPDVQRLRARWHDIDEERLMCPFFLPHRDPQHPIRAPTSIAYTRAIQRPPDLAPQYPIRAPTYHDPFAKSPSLSDVFQNVQNLLDVLSKDNVYRLPAKKKASNTAPKPPSTIKPSAPVYRLQPNAKPYHNLRTRPATPVYRHQPNANPYHYQPNANLPPTRTPPRPQTTSSGPPTRTPPRPQTTSSGSGRSGSGAGWGLGLSGVAGIAGISKWFKRCRRRSTDDEVQPEDDVSVSDHA